MLTPTNNRPPIFSAPTNGLTTSPRFTNEMLAPRTRSLVPPDQGTITIPPYTGDTVVIDFPSQPNGFLEIIIGGKVYRKSNVNPPPPGFYFWDYVNAQLIITPLFDINGLSLLFRINSQARELISTEITNYPEWFNNFVIQSFSYETPIQAHPSGTLTIIEGYESREAIESFFGIVNGLSTAKPFVIAGVGFRVAGCSFEEVTNIITNQEREAIAALPVEQRAAKRKEIQGRSRVQYTINFQGYWEAFGQSPDSPLDQPVSLRSLINSNGSNETLGGTRIANDPNQEYFYTVGQLAATVGVLFSGTSRKIKVATPLSNGDSVTLRSVLTDDRFYPDGKIINWANPARIELLEWDTLPTYVLEDRLAKVVGSCGVFPVKLSNAVLTLDPELTKDNQGDVWSELETGRTDYQSPPTQLSSGWSYEAFNYEQLKSPNWCFDNTSEKTIYKRTLLLNGEDIFVTEEEWGFVYTSLDTYGFSIENGEARIFFDLSKAITDAEWRMVRRTEQLFIHDTARGNYLLFVRGGTQRLTRVTQESEQEAINLAADIALSTDQDEIAELQRQLAGFTNFFMVTEPFFRDDKLENLEGEYPDLKKADEDGDTYIPPLYAIESRRESGATFSVSNPNSTDDEPLPDLIIGTKEREKIQTFVTSTDPEKFKVLTEVFSQEGEDLINSNSSTNQVEQNGRPPLARRVQYFGKILKKTKNAEDELPFKYLISTDEVPPNNLENGSLSFPDIINITQALKGVDTQFSVENTKLQNLGVDLRFLTTLIPGQKIEEKGVDYRFLGKSESWKIGRNVLLENSSLQLGKDVIIKSTSKRVFEGKAINGSLVQNTL